MMAGVVVVVVVVVVVLVGGLASAATLVHQTAQVNGGRADDVIWPAVVAVAVAVVVVRC